MASKKSNVATLPGTERIHSLELENASLRDALFGILKTLGRVRVLKATANEIREGDGMDVRELSDSWVFTFTPSQNVVPGGVKDGKAGG